jgi:hypothetical protein
LKRERNQAATSSDTTATSAAAQSGIGSNVAAFTGHPGLPIDISTAMSATIPMPPKSKPSRAEVDGAMYLDA